MTVVSVLPEYQTVTEDVLSEAMTSKRGYFSVSHRNLPKSPILQVTPRYYTGHAWPTVALPPKMRSQPFT